MASVLFSDEMLLFFIESTTIDECGDVLEKNITRTVENMLLHMDVVLSWFGGNKQRTQARHGCD